MARIFPAQKLRLRGGLPGGKSNLRVSLGGAEVAMNGLRDQDRLDRASNFVIWKARILSVLDSHRIKGFALRTVAIPVDPTENERYEDAMVKAQCIILDGVKDHVVQHIARRTRQRRCGIL